MAEAILTKTRYAEFANALAASGCKRCALSSSRTHIVVDRGNPAAKILVVGEAPGKTEDLQAKAFVGRAGKVLDDVMASVGLDTGRDMLICNVVKCRPPGNRRPSKEEALACRPFLKRQIDLVDPRVLVLLGATALKHLDHEKKNFSMGEEAGRLFKLKEHPDRMCLVLYHPAALLYNPGLKPAMARHVKTLKNFIDNGYKTLSL